MRDPKRIEKILEELKAYWTKHPDLRLLQALCALCFKCSVDVFYIEDDFILKQLKKENNDDSSVGD